MECYHCELNVKTDKVVEIHIGKAYKTIYTKLLLVKEPTLTVTPIKLSGREEEIDAVIPEEIIDCGFKTEGLHECDDSDFRNYVEKEMTNHTEYFTIPINKKRMRP